MSADENAAQYLKRILAEELGMYDCEVDPATRTISWPDYVHEALRPRAEAAGMTVEVLISTTLEVGTIEDMYGGVE